MRGIEPDLVPRARAGDHDAFAILVERALERLYGSARLILLDADLARDAARDTLVAAWRDIRGLEDPRELDVWLHRILIRTCDRVTGAAAHRSGGDARLDMPTDGDESRHAFGGLAQDDRTILALVYFAELSVADASVALDTQPAETESRRRAAFDALRSLLGIDDTTTAMVDLEWRLRGWLSREAAPPDLTAVSEAVIAATHSTPQRRRRLVPTHGRRPDRPGTRRLTGRRIGVAILTAFALVVAISGGVLLTRVVRPSEEAEHRPPTGALSPTGDISALAGSLDQPVIAVLGDGRVLVVGLGEVLLGGIIYDPATGTYGDAIRDEVLRKGSTATTLGNNLVLLTGGTFGGSETPSDTAVLFDPVSSTFATTTRMSAARMGHTATLLDDGRVLIAGGRHPSGRSSAPQIGQIVTDATAEIYDPATGAFTPTSPMIHARAGHTSTKLQDGRVLITGGYISTQSGDVADAVAEAEVFDPATGTFRPAGMMITPRGDHTATLLGDGRVLIAGGADRFSLDAESRQVLPNAELFDPKTATFSSVRSLVTERANHSATLLPDGRVLVAGGRNQNGDPRTTEIFDPHDGAFTAGPVAAAPHSAALAPLISGSRVLLTGSGPGASEIFDPQAAPAATATVAPDGRASSPVQTAVMHDRPSLVELDDGRILILGGSVIGGGERTGVSEIFDPATGGTSPTGPRLALLTDVATTRLPDGRILVAGTDTNGEGAAEIFDPTDASYERPSAAVTDALRGRHPVSAPGLPDGHLVVGDGGNMIQSFDATTGSLGQPITSCESPQTPIALDATRIIVSCTYGSDTMIVDLIAGTTEPIGVQFNQAIALDARRIALGTARYEYLGFGQQPNAIAGRITTVYDALDRATTDLPQDALIGGTVAVVGDRLLAFGSGTDRTDRVTAFDTRTWVSTDIGRMLAPRVGAAATVLRDGRVLVVGGASQSPDRTDPLPPGAEVFDPSPVP